MQSRARAVPNSYNSVRLNETLEACELAPQMSQGTLETVTEVLPNLVGLLCIPSLRLLITHNFDHSSRSADRRNLESKETLVIPC